MSNEIQIYKENKIVFMPNLPMDLVNYILKFAPIVNPSSKCIKRLIDVYNEDHNWSLTKQYRLYYIKNIMSFECYYWDTRCDPEEYMLGPNEYNYLD